MSTSNLTHEQQSISNTDVALTQRRVAFDFSLSPMHWIPKDPYTSQFISVIHAILPAGEFFFCRLYNKALPHITDARLRQDVKGFIKQEAMHARAHTVGINEFLKSHNLEIDSYIATVEWLFNTALDDKPLGIRLPKALERQWLLIRLGLIAAIEHFTCVLGKYALDNRRWELQGADTTMLDILRWHAAEEVEHRSVAFDVYQHLGGSYSMRYLQMLIVAPAILGLWSKGASHLMGQDPSLKSKRPSLLGTYFWAAWQKRAKHGSLPSIAWLLAQSTRYLRPNYNPRYEAETQQAIEYLLTSPAALRAAQGAHYSPVYSTL